jgi:hypothetical protein
MAAPAPPSSPLSPRVVIRARGTLGPPDPNRMWVERGHRNDCVAWREPKSSFWASFASLAPEAHGLKSEAELWV